MATTITPIPYSDTPYSKMFELVGDGTEGVFSIDDFAAALADGPLRDTLLRESPLYIDRFDLNGLRGDEIRIYIVPLSPSDLDTNLASPRLIYWKAGATTALAGLACTLPAPGETNSKLIIEIRLNHSTQG
jgi:hypothetical protein